MAGRTFAQVNCSILRSRKLRGLDHVDRWVYMCAHLTPLARFTGVFYYPAVMWADDAVLSADELAEALTRIETAGLIEWIADEDFVRVIGCHRQRPPQNASWCVSLVADFVDLLAGVDEASEMALRAAAEFSVAAVGRSLTWKKVSPETKKLRDVVGQFLRSTYQEHQDNFLSALITETGAANRTTKAEVEALLPPLSLHQQDTLPTPCQDHVDIQDVDETRQRRDENKDLDDETTVRNSEFRNEPTGRPNEASDMLKKGEVTSRPGPSKAVLQSKLARGVA